jgi:hypothetical protein
MILFIENKWFFFLKKKSYQSIFGRLTKIVKRVSTSFTNLVKKKLMSE